MAKFFNVGDWVVIFSNGVEHSAFVLGEETSFEPKVCVRMVDKKTGNFKRWAEMRINMNMIKKAPLITYATDISKKALIDLALATGDKKWFKELTTDFIEELS